MGQHAGQELGFLRALIGACPWDMLAAGDMGNPPPAGILLDLAVSKIGPAYSPPWTWITSMFTHLTFLHLLSNLLFLVTLTPLVEDRIGSLHFGTVYFAGGLFATAVFVLLNLPTTAYVLLGASGGLSAVLGAFGRLYPRERIRLWLVVVTLPPVPAVYLVIGFIVLQLLLQPFLPGVAWQAHLGGVAFGFAAAPAIMRIHSSKRAEPLRGLAQLKPLVLDADLEEAYERLATETLPEAQRAWLERFAAKSRCPQCGGPLRLRGSRLSSACGWKVRV